MIAKELLSRLEGLTPLSEIGRRWQWPSEAEMNDNDDLFMAALAIDRAQAGDRHLLAERVRSGKELTTEERALIADILVDRKKVKREIGRPPEFAADRRAFNIAVDAVAYGQDKLSKQVVGDLRDKYGCGERTVRNAWSDHRVEAELFYAAIAGTAKRLDVGKSEVRNVLFDDDLRADMIRAVFKNSASIKIDRAAGLMCGCIIRLSIIRRLVAAARK